MTTRKSIEGLVFSARGARERPAETASEIIQVERDARALKMARLRELRLEKEAAPATDSTPPGESSKTPRAKGSSKTPRAKGKGTKSSRR